jgi:hypothetical protein
MARVSMSRYPARGESTVNKPKYHDERQKRPPRSREPVDRLTVTLDAFFLRHHDCGRVVEDIVDEELETLSVICHRCDTSVVVSLGVSHRR